MEKYRKILAGALILLVVLCVSLLVLYFKTSSVAIKIESQITDKPIIVSNPLALRWWSQKIDYNSSRVNIVIPKVFTSATIKTVRVIYTDQVQDSMQLIDKEGLTQFSLGYVLENEDTLNVYLQLLMTPDESQIDYLRRLEFLTLDALYDLKYSEDAEEGPWRDYFIQDKNYLRFLGYKKTLSDLLVPTANAVCIGTGVRCGLYATYCNGTFDDCIAGQTCEVGGTTGICESKCELQSMAASCDEFTDNQCSLAAALTCGSAGNICWSSNCRAIYDDGGSGATPTPAPAPTCSCGRQECDFSIPNCKCLYIGCKVGNEAGASCVKYTCSVAPPPPTCTSVTFSPTSTSIPVGGITTFTATVNGVANGTVSSVNFVFSPDIAVSPVSDTSSPYGGTIVGINAGTALITGSAIMSGTVRCQGTMTVEVTPLINDPWWQVKDSDLITNGNIKSSVPTGNVLSDDGTGGYPGVTVFGSTLDYGGGTLSSTDWNANTTYSSLKVYNYSTFARQFPEEVVAGASVITDPVIDQTVLTSGGYLDSRGYYWYIYSGINDPVISGDINLADRKVILLIPGKDLSIEGNIALTDGVGFLALFVGIDTDSNGGDITVSGDVTSLEGIYLTDGIFSTGTLGVGTDSQLYARGAVAALGGIAMQRDLADNTGPSELWEYGADQIMLLMANPSIAIRKMSWKEVAP